LRFVEGRKCFIVARFFGCIAAAMSSSDARVVQQRSRRFSRSGHAAKMDTFRRMRRIAGYEIVRVLDRDEYLVCFEAVRSGERARLLVLNRVIAADARASTAFLREAFSSECVESRGLVAVRDAGWDAGACFVVLDSIDGPTLDELWVATRAGTTPLSVPLVTWIGLEMLSALSDMAGVVAALRGNGAVHGDLTPRSVILSTQGDIKLVPTCLGELMLHMPREPRAARLGYRAPEQLRDFFGASPDVRADIYAVGAILWELLAGRRISSIGMPLKAFGAAAGPAVLPLAKLRSDVPRELSDLVARCLERSPSARFSGVEELSAKLRAVAPQPRDPRVTSAGSGEFPSTAPPRA
jgi:serine/threonine protein kinase